MDKKGIRQIHAVELLIHHYQNKKIAFQRLVNTDRFKQWHKIETARHLGLLVDVEKQVDEWMKEENLKIEYY